MNNQGIWVCSRCTLENSVSELFCQVCDNLSPHAAKLGNEPQPTKSDGGGILKFFQDKKEAAVKYLRDARKPKEQKAGIFHQKVEVEGTSDVAGSSKETKENEHPKQEFPTQQKLSDGITNELPTVEGGTGAQPNAELSDVGQVATKHSPNLKGRDIDERDSSRPKENPPQISRQKSRQTKIVRKDQITEAHDRWKDIVRFCEDMKMPFVDDSFPPNNASLSFDGIPQANVKTWLRPKEISIITRTKIKWEVFRNPRPSDIIQGIIGNCWFLSALAVVCEKSELLEQILVTKEICDQGAYQVRICKDGKWTIVLLDDLIPCDGLASPIYSQAARNQLWVPLIEKAVAKSFGCYQALVAGRCIEGLQILTGMPCESIVLQNKPGDLPEDAVDIDLVWVKILTCRNAGYLMGASCGGDITDEDLINHYHDVGLEAQHAYSVLDVQQVNEHRLIRLRNPWGRYSWRGAWSDQSEEWNEELRSRLHPHGSVEGVFWISLPDMINYFDSIDVCKYKPEWTEVTLEGQFASPLLHDGQICVMTVLDPTELDITLFQESNRGSKNESIASLDLMIGVYRAMETTTELKPTSFVIHSNRKLKPSVLCNCFLDPGVYIIIPFAFNHWNSGIECATPPKYVLSIHSSNPVLTEHIAMPKYTFSEALYLMVKKLGKKHEGISGVSCYYMSYRLSGLIVAAENRRADVHLHVGCDCSNSFNVVATRGALKTEDCLPPLTRQVLTILTQLEGAEGYAVSHKLRFRITPKNGFDSFGSHQHPLLTNGLGEVHNPRPL
ncbi:calpain-15-like [Clytia hemisphaerica]|uniref:Uncharacterized protein n=1 Tax=Clytia hemisphaerica TaxID=252671 RepID=A0A7M5X7F2_9CNID